MIISGRIWMLIDKDGVLINDIDTDMIFHNRYLAETDINRMGQYALDNLAGWEDFSTRVSAGDIVIAGQNFGAGSSRQQAVDCFKALDVTLIIAESFGAIYKRNAINSALPILEAPGVGTSGLSSGDIIEVNTKTGEIRNSELPVFKGKPFSLVQTDIMIAGGLFQYGK